MGAGYSEAPLLHRSLKQWPVTYPKISNRRQRARFMMLRSGPDFGTIVQALFWYFFAFAGGKIYADERIPIYRGIIWIYRNTTLTVPSPGARRAGPTTIRMSRPSFVRQSIIFASLIPRN